MPTKRKTPTKKRFQKMAAESNTPEAVARPAQVSPDIVLLQLTNTELIALNRAVEVLSDLQNRVVRLAR